MTTLREAATQALGALEGGADSWQLVGPAIDALKEALVEDAMQKFTDVNQELEAALAEPVQEPVAWLRKDELADLQTCNHRRLGADSPRIWAPFDISFPSPDMGLVAVYTAPPQRKPLTEEEISNIWDGHIVPIFGKNGINPVVFARAIERAHGIKE